MEYHENMKLGRNPEAYDFELFYSYSQRICFKNVIFSERENFA